MKIQRIKYKSASRYIWATVLRHKLPDNRYRVSLQCSDDNSNESWIGDDLDLANSYWQRFNSDARTFVLVRDAI